MSKKMTEDNFNRAFPKAFALGTDGTTASSFVYRFIRHNTVMKQAIM